MSRPFVSAYKAGNPSPDSFISTEKIIYWYRPTPKHLDCDATDTTMVGNANNASGNFFRGRPNGWKTMEDAVFVVSLLTSPGTIEITSGDNTESFNATAGANAFTVPMGLGKQSFALKRDGKTVLEDTSLKEIVDECICGIYNFNAYVGTIPPPETVDHLLPDGLARLREGLRAPCKTNTLTDGLPAATASATVTGACS